MNVKKTLDIFRELSRNKKEPNDKLSRSFNDETKEELDMNSIFQSGGTSIGNNEIKGINDFELISFLIIK